MSLPAFANILDQPDVENLKRCCFDRGAEVSFLTSVTVTENEDEEEETEEEDLRGRRRRRRRRKG